MESSLDLFAMASALLHSDMADSSRISNNERDEIDDESAEAVEERLSRLYLNNSSERKSLKGLKVVERINSESLSLYEFIDRYERKNGIGYPVILEGCTDTWNLDFLSLDV